MAADAEDAPDRLEGAPHPREQTLLFGHEDAERAFLAAIASGKLHHAWLIGGPQGIGKATLAYRVARFLLNGGGAGAADSLAIPADRPAARRIAAQSHPDLSVVRRGLRTDGKGFSAEIRVQDVRGALEVFQSTAGEGGYRVCIVDAADELNEQSANALLKAVEEPPLRSVFLIVSHNPQRLLPTIRSRCRRLGLRPLEAGDLEAAVRSLGDPFADIEGNALAQALPEARGSVRRLIELLDPDVAEVVLSVRRLLDRLPDLDTPRLLSLADAVSKKGAEGSLPLVLETSLAWASARVRERAGQGPARLAPLAEVCDKVARAARETEAYNLDKRPLVLSLFAELAQAVRRTA